MSWAWARGSSSGSDVPVGLVAVLDLEPGGQREPEVGEGPHPGLGGRLVELDVDHQAVLGELGRQPGLLERRR